MLKKEVLRGKKIFSQIYKKGKSFPEKSIILIILKNQQTYNRRAFLASKKVGGSVERNRARRLLRESYRQIEEDLKPGYDMVFVARRGILSMKCADVKTDMEAALRKAGMSRKK